MLVHRMGRAACLNPANQDGFSTAIFDQIIEARRADGRTVFVASYRLPCDAARFPRADALLLTLGASVMRAVPRSRARAALAH